MDRPHENRENILTLKMSEAVDLICDNLKLLIHILNLKEIELIFRFCIKLTRDFSFNSSTASFILSKDEQPARFTF